jgi:hypothetical protein
MSALHAIVYVSSAVHLLSQAEIDHLLERARERNGAAGVTGLLLYDEGNFMQYIEGPRDGLMAIYQIILADPLHRDLSELLNEPVAQREFADWTMAFRPKMLPPFLTPSGKRPPRAAGSGLDTLGPGRALLRSVWAELHHQR